MKKNKLFKWVIPYLHIFVLALVILFISKFLYSYFPQLVKYFFDGVLGNLEVKTTLPKFIIDLFNNATSTKVLIIIIAILIVFLWLIRLTLNFLFSFLKGILGEKMAYDIRLKMHKHIQSLPYEYHNSVDIGDLIQRCTTDINNVQNVLAQQIPNLFDIIATFTIGATQIAFININLLYVTLFVVPIFIVTSIVFFRYCLKQDTKLEEIEARMTTHLQENINGVKVIKAYNREKYEYDEYMKISDEYIARCKKFHNIIGLYWGLGDGLATIQFVITIGFCIFFLQNGTFEITFGDVVMCLMYIGLVIYPIRSLGRTIRDLGKARVSSSRLEAILAEKSEFNENGDLKPELNGEIEFKNVYFKFKNSQDYFLKNLNFKLHSGQTLAIVGKTGSGKTTLINLLARIIEITEGEILLNGINIKSIEKSYLRSCIGICLQDPFLFGMSIKENIKIANNLSSDEEVFECAKLAHMHEEILKFEKGYETLVGEKGVTLSGGQRQRIAIARLLIRFTPVIIFDDSLSALDTKTDLEVRKALKSSKNNRTMIIVTHRIATAMSADKILVLDSGNITNIGTHNQLINEEGLYQNLWKIQGDLRIEFLKERE